MSELELRVRAALGRFPDVEKCYRRGLLNRRALARFLVSEGVATRGQFDALIATLRRIDLGRFPEGEVRDLFPEVRLGLKDRILLLDFEKEKATLERIEEWIGEVDYDRGETLKVVVGTTSIKLIVDERKERSLQGRFDRSKVRHRLTGISEISLTFPEAAVETKGVLSVIARELFLHDVTVAELLTASPELLIYLEDQYVPTAYRIVRELQRRPAAGRAAQ